MEKSKSKKTESLCSMEGLGTGEPFVPVEAQCSHGGVEVGRLKRPAEDSSWHLAKLLGQNPGGNWGWSLQRS